MDKRLHVTQGTFGRTTGISWFASQETTLSEAALTVSENTSSVYLVYCITNAVQ